MPKNIFYEVSEMNRKSQFRYQEFDSLKQAVASARVLQANPKVVSVVVSRVEQMKNLAAKKISILGRYSRTDGWTFRNPRIKPHIKDIGLK